MKATDKRAYASWEAGLQRLIESLSSETHRRASQRRTDLFLALVRQLAEAGHFPEVNSVVDQGGVSRPLTAYVEERGKYWVSELEKSRNINWKGEWRRVDSVAEDVRREYPEAFRQHPATLRHGPTRTCWICSKGGRLKRYGKLRLFIGHDEAELSAPPHYLITNAFHWEGTNAIQTWSARWTSEIVHEFGKECTGFEAAPVRNEEAVNRHFRLRGGAQSILQRVMPEASTSEKFAFAEDSVTCGPRLKAIPREVFRTGLRWGRRLFEEGHSCDQVFESLMPA